MKFLPHVAFCIGLFSVAVAQAQPKQAAAPIRPAPIQRQAAPAAAEVAVT
jgi:hypothetical protein